jgi:hypothetical protein
MQYNQLKLFSTLLIPESQCYISRMPINLAQGNHKSIAKSVSALSLRHSHKLASLLFFQISSLNLPIPVTTAQELFQNKKNFTKLPLQPQLNCLVVQYKNSSPQELVK